LPKKPLAALPAEHRFGLERSDSGSLKGCPISPHRADVGLPQPCSSPRINSITADIGSARPDMPPTVVG
jgi:hypothetical protein